MTTTRTVPLLPVEAYTSPDWFAAEQQAIFSRTWQFAGFVEDLVEPGDYCTRQAGQNNLIVLCGKDHQLRAFHNVCRHRGTQLLRGTGQVHKAMTCPYHRWTYSFEGRLMGVPQKKAQFPNIDLTQFCLHPAAVAVWRGMIFIHPDPQAEPLAEWFGSVEPYLGPHQPDKLVEFAEAATRHEIRANWKIVVENYIDGYHLSHLHADTLYMYDHQHIESGFVGPHFAFYQPLAPDYRDGIEKNAPFPVIDHIPPAQLGAYVPMLFPNLGLAETESDWSIFHITPLAPDKTLVETRSKFMPKSSWTYTKQEWSSWKYFHAHSQKRAAGQEADDPLASGDFMAEDVFICEQLQRSLRSPRFAVDVTAKELEQSIVEFQRVVKEWMGGGG